MTLCCLKCTDMLFSHWLIWRWGLLNKHYRFSKMEMEVFAKIPVIGKQLHIFSEKEIKYSNQTFISC